MGQAEPSELMKRKQYGSYIIPSILRTLYLFSMILEGQTLELFTAENNTLVQQLEAVTLADVRSYQLKTTQERSMDCLKVFQPRQHDLRAVYYGLFHNRQKGVFNIHLAESNDLLIWKEIKLLDTHASQPTIFLCREGGFLMAYEKDAPRSCWIRLRYYENLTHLLEGRYTNENDIPRSLAPTAEGTPSFESVVMGPKGINHSKIRLRFHYFKHVRVDQLAMGTLTDFKHWQAKPSVYINEALIKSGWNGNLGDRDPFTWKDKTYILQETQRNRNDWSSWRINLCDEKGMPIRTLAIKTDQHSRAFANPNATWVTDSHNQQKLVITLFLPSEGNAPEEAGTLLYVINSPSKRE